MRIMQMDVSEAYTISIQQGDESGTQTLTGCRWIPSSSCACRTLNTASAPHYVFLKSFSLQIWVRRGVILEGPRLKKKMRWVKVRPARESVFCVNSTSPGFWVKLHAQPRHFSSVLGKQQVAGASRERGEKLNYAPSSRFPLVDISLCVHLHAGQGWGWKWKWSRARGIERRSQSKIYRPAVQPPAIWRFTPFSVVTPRRGQTMGGFFCSCVVRTHATPSFCLCMNSESLMSPLTNEPLKQRQVSFERAQFWKNAFTQNHGNDWIQCSTYARPAVALQVYSSRRWGGRTFQIGVDNWQNWNSVLRFVSLENKALKGIYGIYIYINIYIPHIHIYHS